MNKFIVRGVAEKLAVLKTATGTVPAEPRFMLLGTVPGLISMGAVTFPWQTVCPWFTVKLSKASFICWPVKILSWLHADRPTPVSAVEEVAV